LFQILLCVIEVNLVFLQERVNLQPRLEAQQPTNLLLGKTPATISFEGDTLCSSATEILPASD
jgi:hypothetical protein